MFRKTVLGFTAVAALAAAALAPTSASAWGHRHHGFGLGFGGFGFYGPGYVSYADCYTVRRINRWGEVARQHYRAIRRQAEAGRDALAAPWVVRQWR